MVGDDRVRFCGKCEKNVYNLSAMPREEAAELVRLNEGNLCARMFQRADGTLMSGDCQVGAHKKRVRRAAVAAVGGGLLAASLLVMSRRGQAACVHGPGFASETLGELHVVEPQPLPAVMGSIAPPPPQADRPPQPKPVVMGRIPVSRVHHDPLDSH
jgi:hypothetical protein